MRKLEGWKTTTKKITYESLKNNTSDNFNPTY